MEYSETGKLPDSDPAMELFTLLRASTPGTGARLGRLSLPGRNPVDTPNFFSGTSRGVVPHLTPDNLRRHADMVRGAYMAFEDFIERNQRDPTRVAPLLQTTDKMKTVRAPLHAFTALPDPIPTVLGARRMPPAACSLGNMADSVSVFTSTGVQTLTTAQYADAIVNLRPDVVIPMADLTFTTGTPSSKRAVRMADRTEDWMIKLRKQLDGGSKSNETAIFAPTLPIPHPIQWEYLRCLNEDMVGFIKGLAVYDIDILPDLAGYDNLNQLPRLSLDLPSTPHQILRQISLGADVILLPFINAFSEAGVAFTFTLPTSQNPSPPAKPSTLLPLGVDLSSPTYNTSLSPLSDGCTCPACTSHHRAYVHHLLSAREMLAWTLLQVHNHHVVASLFAAARASLVAGTFEADAERFAASYEADLPIGGGERPRARGYNNGKGRGPGEAPPPRLNRPAWGKLGEVNSVQAAAAAAVPAPMDLP
ncbi:tRNA-guanine transglycosylase [Pyricularia oryzae 70-15]|uniref:Queuine tRNA-ribosyltransferase accessory subunit 2 n=3 Tax=Pyricularia oryzae TaxID=318829 RepID=G4N197_PYRO7|nr:tRNA-guanine transglycosylase [Pyricularia oryzae 70-15]EHA51576.1 tRNA-guanine transglycosylase [Pyricularia oryzae 70-15]ELQ38107.1 tRNA-guanine transglycosylase family protein [Pyricularia oryzae Y34]KAI7926846.1 tRNA-guanine transglycosylase [Pyricularia oryzae]KAI7928306.1 tRNA-guanine transglycosylase [Pyricularia oryzae]